MKAANFDSGEHRPLACCRRQLADDQSVPANSWLDQRAFRRAAEKNGPAACAPRN